ncbi:hypothetical protein OVS_02695 [Mycoplasma ovis str. Michigan]|uniref:Tripartite tricarboxylate transporter substrate binding protein n=1 Tax=Mycoplasma ovis str. Michigan TaxID=1415773 RepID=A0ABM5P1I1_9MOLU|nr:hypothetical protein [Mycoplasma ovis]AHC40347.1 hypothetical protein OVS_02695 [Mycoplasma ovis str. Michigan]
MSFLTKILQGFAGAGVIATIPFTLASDPKEQEINIFLSGGGEGALKI